MGRRASIGGEVTLGTRKAKAALRELKGDVEKHAREIGAVKVPEVGGKGGLRWTELKSKIDLASGAARGFGSAVKKVFDSEAGFENLIRALASTSDGTETLRDELDALRETAKLPGLGFREAIQGATALKGAGLEAKKAREFLEAFGNALANSGKGKAELDGVITSVEQIFSTKTVDQGNLKEISRRVTGFFDLIAGIDRSDPGVFFDKVVERLKQLPKAAESARDSVDNLQDTIDQKRLGLTGGKVAGAVGTLAGQVGSFVTGNGFDAGEVVDAFSGEDVISKYQPDAGEIDRRRRQKAQAAADMAREREENAVAEMKSREEMLRAELELQRAQAMGGEEVIAAAEDRLDVLREAKGLAEALAISEERAAEFIRRQNGLRREADREIKQNGQAKVMNLASGRDAGQLKVDSLRASGRELSARRLEKKLFIQGETERLRGEGFADPEGMAAEGWRNRQAERTGRRSIKGGRLENKPHTLDKLNSSQYRHDATYPSNIPGFADATRQKHGSDLTRRKEERARQEQAGRDGRAGMNADPVLRKLDKLDESLQGVGEAFAVKLKELMARGGSGAAPAD